MSVTRTPTGIAYDRAGPSGDVPVVLLHAGVADRRMWEAQWRLLTARRDVLRLDLRGFGDSTDRPRRALSPVEDVVGTLAHVGIGRCHLVGASYGAGVAVETALTHPALVASLLLSAPGGSLITEATPDLQAFWDAERAALAAGDLGAAVEANLVWWVDGLGRPRDVDPAVRAQVGRMQRRAFEVTAGWEDVSEDEMHPPAVDRLVEVDVPTLVLVGSLDLEAITRTAQRVTMGIRGARRVDWPDTAHLPSMERPDAFLTLLEDWLDV